LIRPIEYTVSLEAPQTQTFQVTMLVRNVASRTLDVAMPVWRQGKYAVIHPAATVRSVNAATAANRPLRISKTDKTTWRIETEGATEILIRYTVYANSLNDRTRHVDDTHAFLSGATVFLYVPDRRKDELLVRLEAPVDWRVSCGLEHDAADTRTLLAPDYDVLIDSPIEVGLHDRVSFEVDGKPHEIMLWGGVPFDADRLERDFAQITRTEAAIFGVLPYDRYVFMLHVAPGLSGGTEHLNSTIMQMPPQALEDEGQYKILLSLVAHEMFHTWNVKRLRPASLRNIDLAHENYTDLLWFCEGTTSYYDELIVVRAGFETPEAYLAGLAESIYQRRARPGALVQNLAESSFDAWIKFNNPTPDDVNSTISYYEGGALVSLLLDLDIRKRSNNRASLDTLLREMYNAFPASGPGFTTEDLVQTLNRITNSRFEEFFDKYIRAASPYPFEDLFDVVGLEMIPRHTAPRAYSGLSVQDNNGACIVRSVLSDGPAYLAGVNCGDEIVSLNGRKFKAPDINPHLEQTMAPGDTVWLQLLRRNRLRRVDFKLATKPNPRWDFRKTDSPSKEQRAAYESWLGRSF
jgi:predicted metalloprotease with PDZ domain